MQWISTTLVDISHMSSSYSEPSPSGLSLFSPCIVDMQVAMTEVIEDEEGSNPVMTERVQVSECG